jgi:hypothetical protein
MYKFSIIWLSSSALPRKVPTCAVCPQDRTTRLHPCKIPSCKRKPACTHSSIMCRAYQEPHKASDSGYPSKAKAEISAVSHRASGARIGENHLSTLSFSIPPTENESIHARSGYTPPPTEASDISMQDAVPMLINH